MKQMVIATAEDPKGIWPSADNETIDDSTAEGPKGVGPSADDEASGDSTIEDPKDPVQNMLSKVIKYW